MVALVAYKINMLHNMLLFIIFILFHNFDPSWTCKSLHHMSLKSYSRRIYFDLLCNIFRVDILVDMYTQLFCIGVIWTYQEHINGHSSTRIKLVLYVVYSPNTSWFTRHAFLSNFFEFKFLIFISIISHSNSCYEFLISNCSYLLQLQSIL